MTAVKQNHGAAEAARHGVERSPEWPRAEKEHLQREPNCAACTAGGGTRHAVQVHHIFPFHYCVLLGRPDLELDQRNLITLCETESGHHGEDHHLLIGHLDDFKSSNLEVINDARKTFSGMTAEEIKADPRWQLKRAAKLKPFDKMSQQEKDDFAAQMNKVLPKE